MNRNERREKILPVMEQQLREHLAVYEMMGMKFGHARVAEEMTDTILDLFEEEGPIVGDYNPCLACKYGKTDGHVCEKPLPKIDEVNLISDAKRAFNKHPDWKDAVCILEGKINELVERENKRNGYE